MDLYEALKAGTSAEDLLNKFNEELGAAQAASKLKRLRRRTRTARIAATIWLMHSWIISTLVLAMRLTRTSSPLIILSRSCLISRKRLRTLRNWNKSSIPSPRSSKERQANSKSDLFSWWWRYYSSFSQKSERLIFILGKTNTQDQCLGFWYVIKRRRSPPLP